MSMSYLHSPVVGARVPSASKVASSKKLSGCCFRLQTKLALQSTDTELILPESRRASTQLDVEPHDRAMNGLLQRVEGDEPERCPQRRFGRARRALVKEELR